MPFTVKPDWYVSKTFWGAVVTAVGGVLSNLFLEPEVAGTVNAIGVVVVPMLLLVLRVVTGKESR